MSSDSSSLGKGSFEYQSLLGHDGSLSEGASAHHVENRLDLSGQYDDEAQRMESQGSTDIQLDAEEPPMLYSDPSGEKITVEEYEALLQTKWIRIVLIVLTMLTFGILFAAGIMLIFGRDAILGAISLIISCSMLVQIFHIQGIGARYITRKFLIIFAILAILAILTITMVAALATWGGMRPGMVAAAAFCTELCFFIIYRFPNGKAVMRSSFFE